MILGCTLGLNACNQGKSGGDGGKEIEADGSPGTEKSLNLLIWSGTISPATLAHFETLTGIKLRVSYAVSNEDIETRLMTGHSGFDVVGAAADYLQRELQAGAYLPLDKSKLPYLANMDPELMRKWPFTIPTMPMRQS